MLFWVAEMSDLSLDKARVVQTNLFGVFKVKIFRNSKWMKLVSSFFFDF